MDLERKHLRLPLNSRVFIELDAPINTPRGESTLAICTTLDVSAQGMQVALDRELEEHAYLQIGVEPPQEEASEPFFLIAQVKWCRPGDSSEQAFVAGLALMQARGSDIDHWIALISNLEE